MTEIDAPEIPRAEFTLITGEKIIYDDFKGLKVHEVFDDLFPRLAIIRHREGLDIQSYAKETDLD